MLIHRGTSERASKRGGSEDREVLLLLNSGGRSKPFTLPTLVHPGSWTELVNTSFTAQRPGSQVTVNLVPRSLMLLQYELP
jgi:hypothetical protein